MPAAYHANKRETRVVNLEDVLVQARYTLMNRSQIWQEWEAEVIASREDNGIYVVSSRTVCEMNCASSGVKGRYLGVVFDLRVLEWCLPKYRRVIAK
jgi:hypothetical protein